jgi:hypothetical protein
MAHHGRTSLPARIKLNGKPDLRHNGAIAVSELDDYVAEPVRT